MELLHTSVQFKSTLNFKNLLRIFIVAHHNKNDNWGAPNTMREAHKKMLAFLEPTSLHTNKKESGVPANRFLPYRILCPIGKEATDSAWHLGQILREDYRTYHPSDEYPKPLKDIQLDQHGIIGADPSTFFEDITSLYIDEEIKTIFIVDYPSQFERWLSGLNIQSDKKVSYGDVIGINLETKEVFQI